MPLLINFAPKTVYRTVEIRWLPRSQKEWATYTAVRSDCANLYNHLVTVHMRIRRLKWKWPTYAQLERAMRGKFPSLGAQSTQMVVRDFCDNIYATSQIRKYDLASGKDVLFKYPWRNKSKYRDVPYSNQCASLHGNSLRLLNSARRGSYPITITMPPELEIPGRIMEVVLCYGIVRIICEVTKELTATVGPFVGIDLGVNTMLSATDGNSAVLVSGRSAKSIIQYRNKTNARLRSRIDRSKVGSKRRKRLILARLRMSDKSSRKMRDLLHKSTRIVSDTFPANNAAIGKPFNDASSRVSKKQAQQVSQASNHVLISQLAYKMISILSVLEHYSSQTCPVCGCRQRCRRVYKCKECGLIAPRDVVGAVNIRSIGLYGEMRTNQPIPIAVKWVRPLRKYPRPLKDELGSSGGIPAQPTESLPVAE